MSEKDLQGSAYQTTENRVGPPLEYIIEKTCSAIESQHFLIQKLKSLIPDDFKTEELQGAPEDLEVKQSYFLGPALTTFDYQIKTFLALRNRLGLYDRDKDLVQKLASGTNENLNAWLTRVEFIKDSEQD